MGQLIDEISQYLQTNGIGTIGTNLFVGFMPPTPDAAVALFETTGMKPDIDIPLHDPSFQVLIRNTEFDLGHVVMDAIKTLLHDKYNIQFVTNGIYVYRCNLVAEGGHIGQDTTGRDMFSTNYQTRTR